ncbi:MAG TPA: TPM domain-containing protein [Candidatus Limnocylindrales bacterium]|nr:TPM domain-containing protein [Candidatus Limnocylindrales bacterium]
MARRTRQIIVAAVVTFVALSLAGAGRVGAAGPPFPDRISGQAVYDTADVLDPAARRNAEQVAEGIASQSGVDVVVYTQRLDAATTSVDATADAQALLEAWQVGGDEARGAAIVADISPDGSVAGVALAGGTGFADYVDPEEQAKIGAEMADLARTGDLGSAILVALSRIVAETLQPGAMPGVGEPNLRPGPPFPDPIDNQAVYDFAGILSSGAIAKAEATIDAIEARTGAEVVVYSELVDYGVTTDETRQRAAALIDQWGVGRKGFDDGLAIFFDIDPSHEHGQVQLYAGPGFEATFLTNNDRQAIYENDMVPFLRNADFDGALGIALQRVDAAATPEHAQRLELGRQVNAVIGLVGGPLVLLGLVGWAFTSWRRYGKDPVYLDDPSILMPAPPADLTAASGALVMDGRSSRRALTTAMLDLASRGLLAFREDPGLLGLSKKVGIDTGPPAGDAVEEARRALNSRRPISPAEEYALRELRDLAVGPDHFIDADKLPEFGTSAGTFDSKLEAHVVGRGWMVEPPSKVVGRWTVKGILAIVAGVVAIVGGVSVPMSGLVVVGVAAIVGGVVVVSFAQVMPSLTMPGAMIRAMLAAYKRTLHKTMEQARSMQQVVDGAGLSWLETPDQAVVWGTALGLQGDIEQVLQRSLDDVRQEPSLASSTYFPMWYQNSSGQSLASGGLAGSGASIFSGSAVPDFGGMMSALGTIGNSPASSGSGGGGFSGGGSGGGGGGAGGGF